MLLFSAFLSISVAINCHILDKSFQKTFFVEVYSSILKYCFLNRILSIYSSLLSAKTDLQKCGRKSSYFIKDKQNPKKTDENLILCNFALSSQNSLLNWIKSAIHFEFNLHEQLDKNFETAKLKFSHFNQNVARALSGRGDNYLLFIVSNSQLINDCYIFNDNFYSCLSAKVKQIAFTNMKTMIFCSEFIQNFLRRFWKLELCFGNQITNTQIRRFITCCIFFKKISITKKK